MTAKIKNPRRYTGNQPKHRPAGVRAKDFEKVYWPYLPVWLLVSILLVFGLQSGSLQAAMHKHTGSVLAYSTSMSVGGLLADTNVQRSTNSVAALSLNSKLNAAAQAKANDMAARNYWSHNTPEGNPPWVFVSAQGYSYQKLGENLAAGFDSEQSTIDGWMASPPHKENLLDPAFTEVGFGYANNPDYTSAGGGPMTIVVAFYGKPTTAAPTPAPIAQTTPPSAIKSTPAPAPVATPQPQPPTPQPTPAPTEPTSQPQTDKARQEAAPQPLTTSSKPKGVTLSLRTSQAQVAFAKLPASSFATGMATFVIISAAGFWISKHLLMLRKVFVYGESFAIKHPMLDVGLIFLAGLSYLLTQTAGFIQ